MSHWRKYLSKLIHVHLVLSIDGDVLRFLVSSFHSAVDVVNTISHTEGKLSQKKNRGDD